MAIHVHRVCGSVKAARKLLNNRAILVDRVITGKNPPI
jgi:hypothetical protein